MTAAERQRRHRWLKAQEQENGIMSEAVLELKVPPPLPETRKALLEQYKLKRRRSINDLVEEIIVQLWDHDEAFMKHVEAIYDSQSIEGSMDDDDVVAAMIIRDTAKRNKHAEVADQNLHTIKLAMRVALRRFDLGRGQRYDLARLPAPQVTETEAPSQLMGPAAE